MDFSTGVIIDFGLNLAGYVIVALLVYVLASRQRRPQPAPAVQQPGNMRMASAARPATYSQATLASQPAFVPLTSEGRTSRFDRVVGDTDASLGAATYSQATPGHLSGSPSTPGSRQIAR